MKIYRALSIVALCCIAAPAAAAGVNMAPLGTATQSSTYPGGAAGNAIDTNRSGNWSTGSVSHTEQNPQAWWQVTLPAAVLIDSIFLFNRTDCCGERLSPFNLHILNGASSQQSFLNQTFSADITGPGISGMTFDTGAIGDIVRVELVGTNYLQLAEVEVFALAAAIPEPSTYALVLVGLGIVGFVANRRRKAQVAA